MLFLLLACTPDLPTLEQANGQLSISGETQVASGEVPLSQQGLKEVEALGALRVGQVWTYKTRPGEEASRLTVLRLEQHPVQGGYVHISLDGLHIPNPADPEKKEMEGAGHLPFSQSAVESSVIAVESTGAEISAESMEGYQTWRAAFDAGQAGVFSSDVASGVDAMQAMMAPR